MNFAEGDPTVSRLFKGTKSSQGRGDLVLGLLGRVVVAIPPLLPRDSRLEANELDNGLNLNPNLAIFRQADNGVLVRMALFALTLGVENLVNKCERDVPWYSNKGYPTKG